MESKPVTFQFTKAVKKSSVIQTSLNSAEKDEEVDFVKSVDDGGIESTKKRKEYVPLVIPLKKPKIKSQKGITNQSLKSTDTKKHDPIAGEDNLDSAAAEELLKEAAGAGAQDEGKTVADIEVASSSIVQGAVIGEVPTLDDYDSVPVEEFGKALLRGMGWKDGDGTGKKGETVGQFEAVVRPKGLGLGASVVAVQAVQAADSDEPPLSLAPGAYVVVTIGKEKGNYGQVSSLDGDGRALVKMAVTGDTSSLPEGALQPVTKKDYKRNSRVINQDKYNEYKERQEREHESARGGRGRERDPPPGAENGGAERESRTSSSSKHGHSHRSTREHKDDAAAASEKRSSDRRSSPPREDRRPWLRPNLRVRCIDQKYKKGRYYKEKLTVVDVITTELCVCKDASGRLLEDVPTGRLETVIPRHPPDAVMVVRGSRVGQVGKLVERDQKRCRATIQLLPDREMVTLDYDDVCQYMGSLDAYE